MNTIRVSERSFALLMLRGLSQTKTYMSARSTSTTSPMKSCSSKQQSSSKISTTFGLSLGNKRRGRVAKIKYTSSGNSTTALPPSRLLLMQPTIKFLNKQTLNYTFASRCLSNEVKIPKDFPLLNPNKSLPKVDDSIPYYPPISQSKFSGEKKSGIPSVTSILKATMSAENVYVLEQWKKSMLKKLGPEGFATYTRETFERGHKLHSIVADFLLGKGEPQIDDKRLTNQIVENLWKSIKQTVTDKISNPRLVEHIVTHKDMQYRGIVDCVAYYEGRLSVIDFKTAEKPKKNVLSLYDNPLQVSAYCGALNNDSSIPSKYLDKNISTAVLIIAYCDGSAADLYYFDEEKIREVYWKQWIERLDQYFKMPQN